MDDFDDDDDDSSSRSIGKGGGGGEGLQQRRPQSRFRKFLTKARDTVSPKVHRELIDENPPFAFVDSMPRLRAIGFNISGLIRLFLLDLRTLITIPIKLAIAALQIIGTLLSMIYPLLLWLFIWWMVFYTFHIFWPFFIKIILVVAIPILNVLIILFNFFFMLFLIILRIGIIVWNIVVPFLGMILYVVINIVLTILAEVFNIIGAIDWEAIISAIMKILLVIVDIAMQILMVFIKVGMEILQIVAEVISFVVEIFMIFVKIWLDYVTWMFKLLFTILEPILEIVGIFFGAISSMFGAKVAASASAMSTSRKLLSLSLSIALLNTSANEFQSPSSSSPSWFVEKDGPSHPNDFLYDYERFVKDTLNLDNRKDDYISAMYSKAASTRLTEHEGDHHFLEDILETSKPFSVFAESSAARRLLQTWKQPSTSGLTFIDDPSSDDLEEENEKDFDQQKDSGKKGGPQLNANSGLDDYAHTMAHTMYTGAKNMDVDDLDLARTTMTRILNTHRNKDQLSIRSLLREFAETHADLAIDRKETVAHANFGNDPEHPRDMHVRFHEERKAKMDQFSSSNTGRKLMGQDEGRQWSTAQKNYMSALEIEHARAIVEQQRTYKKYHEDRVKVATVVYGATTRALRQSVDQGINPENLIKHWDETLDYFGYQDIWSLRDEFVATHGDAVGFITSFSAISEHPFFKYFKEKDDSRLDSPYFHDWAIEQRKQEELRRNYRLAQKTGGRSLLQVQSNEDSNVAGSDAISKGSGGGFATLSTLNCFSSPKNPMCIPEIPWSFKFSIPTIKLTDKQKKTIQENTDFCEPWKVTYCVICLKRFWNVWQSFRFLISTIPLINYPIATLTVLAPWLAWAFNWIFLVPKFHVGTLFQFVCFFYHLYDVFIVVIALWLARKIFVPIIQILWTTIQNFQLARLPDEPSAANIRRQNALERFWQRMQDRGEIESRIGGAYHMTQSYYSSDDDDDDGELEEEEERRSGLRRRRRIGGGRRRRREIPRNAVELQQHRTESEHDELTRLYRQLHGSNAENTAVKARIYRLLRIMHERQFEIDTDNIDETHAEAVRNHFNTHVIHRIYSPNGPPSSSSSSSSSSSKRQEDDLPNFTII